jgi:hypothetical protein
MYVALMVLFKIAGRRSSAELMTFDFVLLPDHGPKHKAQSTKHKAPGTPRDDETWVREFSSGGLSELVARSRSAWR